MEVFLTQLGLSPADLESDWASQRLRGSRAGEIDADVSDDDVDIRAVSKYGRSNVVASGRHPSLEGDDCHASLGKHGDNPEQSAFPGPGHARGRVEELHGLTSVGANEFDSDESEGESESESDNLPATQEAKRFAGAPAASSHGVVECGDDDFIDIVEIPDDGDDNEADDIIILDDADADAGVDAVEIQSVGSAGSRAPTSVMDSASSAVAERVGQAPRSRPQLGRGSDGQRTLAFTRNAAAIMMQNARRGSGIGGTSGTSGNSSSSSSSGAAGSGPRAASATKTNTGGGRHESAGGAAPSASTGGRRTERSGSGGGVAGGRGGRGGRGGARLPRSGASSSGAGGGTGGGTGGSGGGGGGRGCPFYKRIPHTPSFIVDGFQYASPTLSKHYFLSHFHSDHYGGLNKHFDAGTIYCSSITAALVHSRLGVPRRFLRVLPMDTPVSVAGVTVTLLSANHCPGAVMFLFDCPPPMGVGRHHRYLHVGDFRWHRSMMKWPLLRGVAMSALADAAGGSVPSGFSIGGLSAGASLFGGAGAGITAVAPVLSDAAAGADAAPKLTPPKGRLDALYLDTTYCEPSHAFPPQEACVAAVRQTALAFASDPGVLLLFGAYTIGKERVFMEVARALNERIYVDATRYRTLSLLEWPLEDRARLTSDPSAARIHVVPMGYLSLGRLHERLRGIREAAEAALAARIDVAFAAVAGAGTTPAAAVPLAAGRPALAPVSAAANARPVATSAARPTATATPKPFPGAPPDDASAGPNVFIAGVAATPHPQDAPEPVLGSALGIALPSTVRDFTGARRSLGFNKFVGLKKGATGTSTGVFAVPTPAGLPTTSAGMIGSISAAADTAVIAVEEDEVEPSITGVGSKRMAPVPGRGRGRGRGRGKAIGAGYFERIAQLGAAQAHAHATGASTDEGVEDADFGADLAAGSDGGILSVFAPAPAAARAHAAGNASGASPGHGASNGHAAHAASRGSALGLRPVPARQFTGHHDDDGFDGGQDDFDDNDNDDDDGDFGGAGFLPEDAEAVAWSQDVAQLGSSSSSGGVSFGVGAVRAAGGASSSSGNAGTGAIAPHSRTTPAQLLPQASFRVSGAGALGQVAASASAPASAASSSLHSSSAAPLPPPSRKYGPFHSIVAFKPTGWAYAPAAAGKPTHGASATGSSSGSGSGHWQGHGQGQGQSQPGDTFQLVDIAARITADSLEAEARREWEERQRQRDRQRQQAGIAGPGAGLGASGASGGTGAALSFNAMDRREGADDLDLPGAGASGLRASGAAGAALDASPVAIDDIVDARRPAAVAQRVFVDDAAALPLPNGASAPLRSSAAGPSVAGTAGGHGSGNAGPASTSAAAAPPSLAGIASSSASAPAGLALASRVVTVRMTKQTRAGGARIHPGGALAPAPAQAPAQAQAPAVPSHAAGSATPASGSRPGVAPVPAAGPGLSARGPVPEPPSPAICMLARQLCVPVAALQAFMLAPAAPPAAPRSAPGGQGGQRTGAAATAAAALPAGTPSGSAPSSTTATATAPAAAAESARRRKLPPGGVTLFSVPYSEHSSFDELRECVAFLDPVAIVPTVNCRSAADAARIVRMMRATDPAAAAAGDDV